MDTLVPKHEIRNHIPDTFPFLFMAIGIVIVVFIFGHKKGEGTGLQRSAYIPCPFLLQLLCRMRYSVTTMAIFLFENGDTYCQCALSYPEALSICSLPYVKFLMPISICHASYNLKMGSWLYYLEQVPDGSSSDLERATFVLSHIFTQYMQPQTTAVVHLRSIQCSEMGFPLGSNFKCPLSSSIPGL